MQRLKIDVTEKERFVERHLADTRDLRSTVAIGTDGYHDTFSGTRKECPYGNVMLAMDTVNFPINRYNVIYVDCQRQF